MKNLEIESWGYQLWYTGRDRNHNGVGVIINKQLLEDVVEVRRKGDRILLVKLILSKEIFNVISVYAPQVGLDEYSKQQFWENLDEIVEGIPIEERFFIDGGLNGHVGTSRYGFNSVHEGFGFGKRNEPGNSILNFALSYDLILANTWFRKRESLDETWSLLEVDQVWPNRFLFN